MFIEPMLARAAEEQDLPIRDWAGWVLEPKHDGMRAIVSVTDAGVEIYSRTGKSQKGKCPHLESQFATLPPGTVLDGELCIVENARTIAGRKVPVVNFNKTMRIMGSGTDKALARQDEFGKIVFLIFDVIQYDGISYADRSQKERTALIDTINLNYVMHNPQYTDSSKFTEIYAELIASGVEGAIMKNGNACEYISGRSKNWLKVKSAKTFDVVISGFTEGKGKYAGQIGAIEFGAYFEDGGFAYVGRCSGMTDEERKHYTDIRDGNKHVNTPIVIEVKANEMVGSGEYRTPRHPQFVTERIDKNPEACLMDQFKA